MFRRRGSGTYPRRVPKPAASPSELVGLSLEAAEEWAATHGRTLRVVDLDAHPGYVLTADFRPNRVTVRVLGGKVTAANSG